MLSLGGPSLPHVGRARSRLLCKPFYLQRSSHIFQPAWSTITLIFWFPSVYLMSCLWAVSEDKWVQGEERGTIHGLLSSPPQNSKAMVWGVCVTAKLNIHIHSSNTFITTQNVCKWLVDQWKLLRNWSSGTYKAVHEHLDCFPCSLFSLCLLQRMKQLSRVLKVRYLRVNLDETIICVTSTRKRTSGLNVWPSQRRKKKIST